MDSKFKDRIQRKLYHTSEMAAFSAPSLPLTEASVEYFQNSFPGCEGLGRLDMAMAASVSKRKEVSPCSVVMSMLYAKRLRQHNKHYLQSMSSTDVFFISMMMASKYLYDEGVEEEVYNDEWADTVGQDVEDVNKMEMDFLKEMDWQLFVKPEEFDQALTALERRLALREGARRGWFTYTELAVLLDWQPVYDLWNQVGLDCTKVISLLSALYAAGLISFVSSATIAIHLSGPMASVSVAMLSSLHASLQLTGSSTPIAPVTVPLPCHVTLKMDSVVNKYVTNECLQLTPSTSGLEGELPVDDGNGHNNSIGAGQIGHQTSANRPMAGQRQLAAEIMSVNGSENETESMAEKERTKGLVESSEWSSGVQGKSGTLVTKVKQASLLSLWLLDSFISQLLSVISEHGNRSGREPGVGDSAVRQNTCSDCSLHRHTKAEDDEKKRRRKFFTCRRGSDGEECNCHKFDDQMPDDSDSSSHLPTSSSISCFRSNSYTVVIDYASPENDRINGERQNEAGDVRLGHGCGSSKHQATPERNPNSNDRKNRLSLSPSLCENCCLGLASDLDPDLKSSCVCHCSCPFSSPPHTLNSDLITHKRQGLETLIGAVTILSNGNFDPATASPISSSPLADMPILDPVGFFTRNTPPIYAL